MHRREFLAGAAVLATAAPAADRGIAQPMPVPVKIGVLTDMSSIYSDISGQGSVEAVKLAIEDNQGSVLGSPVEVLSADHQNKADIGSSIARRWYDLDGVDVIVDVNNSAVAFGVSQIAEAKQKLVLFVGAASTELTGKYCSAYAAQWLYDTYSVVRGTVEALHEGGARKWFFITADYAFGHSLEAEAAAILKARGAQNLGAVRVPIGTGDFSSFILQAQSSGADVIGLALSGADLVNVVKQGAEFGVRAGSQQFAALLATEANIHSLGPQAAQGIKFSSPFYWDLDDATRAFSTRFRARMKRPPTMMQAGVYSAVSHHLKALKAIGTKDPLRVMQQMRATPIDDFMTRDGRLRIDGRVVRDVYLFEAKSPRESRDEWDIYKLLRTTPGRVATRPLDPSCKLVKA